MASAIRLILMTFKSQFLNIYLSYWTSLSGSSIATFNSNLIHFLLTSKPLLPLGNLILVNDIIILAFTQPQKIRFIFFIVLSPSVHAFDRIGSFFSLISILPLHFHSHCSTLRCHHLCATMHLKCYYGLIADLTASTPFSNPYFTRTFSNVNLVMPTLHESFQKKHSREKISYTFIQNLRTSTIWLSTFLGPMWAFTDQSLLHL